MPKISALSPKSPVSGTDIIPVVSGTTTYYATLATLLAYIDASKTGIPNSLADITASVSDLTFSGATKILGSDGSKAPTEYAVTTDGLAFIALSKAAMREYLELPATTPSVTNIFNQSDWAEVTDFVSTAITKYLSDGFLYDVVGWTPSTSVTKGTYYLPVTNTHNYIYLCTQAGLTGTSEPTWLGRKTYTIDGTAEFTAFPLHSIKITSTKVPLLGRALKYKSSGSSTYKYGYVIYYNESTGYLAFLGEGYQSNEHIDEIFVGNNVKQFDLSCSDELSASSGAVILNEFPEIMEYGHIVGFYHKCSASSDVTNAYFDIQIGIDSVCFDTPFSIAVAANEPTNIETYPIGIYSGGRIFKIAPIIPGAQIVTGFQIRLIVVTE